MEGSIKILLIEDDLHLADMVRQRMQKFNPQFEVATTTSGDSCLKMLNQKEEVFGAIILDYQLPDCNGLDLLSEIEKANIDTPVVVVSGQGSEQVAVEALKKGAYDYLVKDTSFLTVLPKVIQKTIENYHLELKLKESEHKYRHIFEKANDAILIINPQNMNILETNIKATEILKYQKDELIGLPFQELYPEEQRLAAKKLLEDTFAKGVNREDSLSIRTRDAELVPVDINASVIEFGKYQYILGILRSTAEKRKLQQQILNSKRRLQSMFDGITDIIYQVNKDFEIVIANKAFADGCRDQPENLIGKKCYQVYYGNDDVCSDCPAQVTFNIKQPKIIEKKHGEIIFEIKSYPIFDFENTIESVALYSKNITEKKKLEKSLIQSEKLATIGLLSSGISHEIRNPLNIIETARYYIEEYLPDHNPDIIDKLQIIRKNVRRASNIINNLLEFSRDSQHEKEKIKLSKLIESAVALLGKELTANNIEFHFEPDPGHDVYFNIDSLKQVLLNIFINAIQAMPKGGKLTITTEKRDDNYIDLKISDTGVGIPEDQLAQIYTPFFTTKRAGFGTGLGLYVSQMIIEKGGGSIQAESRVNEGTTFILTLPASESEEITVVC
ncbi:MAG: ATP-binding protein [bacterium]